MASEGAGDLQNIAQIGRSVFVGRCSDCRKDHLDLIEARAQIGREVEASGFDVAAHEFAQSGFVDGNFAGEQPFDFLAVDIDACNVDACFSKAGSGDEPDVTGSNDGDIHILYMIYIMIEMQKYAKSPNLPNF